MSDPLGRRLVHNLQRVISGDPEAIEHVVIACLAGGHVLVEDVPGVGKTMLAKTLARSIEVSFRRIQFTSDLLPSDVLGVSVFRPEQGEFEFKPGPVFGHVVLADELNRAPPRTQSSLLEALEDGTVTIDGATYELPQPFMVVATQNPIEFAGTYALPESELDRFLLVTQMGYPDRAAEREILARHGRRSPFDDLPAIATAEELLAERKRVDEVRVDDTVIEYLLDLVEATRRDGRFRLGASPRGTLAFERAIRARALLNGRDYCVPEDVKELAIPVLAHRILPSAIGTDGNAVQAGGLIESLLERVRVPV